MSCMWRKDRYMAPEVFKHRKYDKKVDVFSFAMILYEVSFAFASIEVNFYCKRLHLTCNISTGADA